MNSISEEIVSIAKNAGAQIMEIYNSKNFEIIIKDDNSPLTKADIASNEIIMDGLRSVSSYPIISEETIVDYSVRKKWNMFWLVDPLDGTKDFIAKNGQFTVNIALIKDCRSILGVVYIPVQGITYWAEQGKGAYRDGERIYNNSKRMGSDLIAAESVFHSSQETVEFLQKHRITNIKRFGSSLKYCKLAEGEIDIYPRFNGTKEWDTAAGHILLLESGCKIIDAVTGGTLIYNKPSINNNYFVAMRNDLNEI